MAVRSFSRITGAGAPNAGEFDMQNNTTAIRQAANETADDAKSFVDRASDAVSSGFNTVADTVTDGVANATHAGSDLQGWAGEKLSQLRDRVQEEPIKALAITAGIGAILGALFLRR
jgi:ElaB/YqjD/DUF883 family membrane-anchored ribosome-binding protein